MADMMRIGPALSTQNDRERQGRDMMAKLLMGRDGDMNHPLTGGALTLSNKMLASHLMNREEEREKARANRENEALSAILMGKEGSPWDNPDTPQNEARAAPQGGLEGMYPILREYGDTETARKMMAQMLMRKVDSAMAPPPAPPKPMSRAGKLQHDFDQGLLNEAGYRAGMEGLNAPLVDMGADQGGVTKEVYGRYGDARTRLQDAAAAMDRLKRVGQVAANSPSGFGADARLSLGKAMQAMGIEVDDAAIQNAELFKSLQMDLVMDRIAGTKGPVSEKEMDAFVASVPSLSNTPEGNALLVRTLQEIERRKLHLAQYETDLIRNNPGASVFEVDSAVDAEAARLSQSPLFNQLDQSVMQQASQADQFPRYMQGEPGQIGSHLGGNASPFTREQILQELLRRQQLRGQEGGAFDGLTIGR